MDHSLTPAEEEESRVYNHRAKNSRSHGFSIFGVIVCAHHAVVVCGEHAPDCAEDYDAKDGDDDACPCVEC